MRIKWGSATDLATNFKREFLKENSKDLTISIDKHSPSANLLSVAKLLAFIRALTNDYGYEVCVEIEDSGIKKSAYLGLVKLGFPALLAEIGVICKVTRAKKSARESSTASGEAESFENAVANEKYESVIVPLSQFQFEISEVSVKSAASDRLKWVETETDKLVSGIVSNVNAYLGKRINVRPEFACSVLPVLRELVQNCLQHSPVSDARRIDESELRKRSHMIVYAITMSRESQPKYVRTSRPGSSLVGWEDKLDVLVQDFGQGVLSSVRDTLYTNPTDLFGLAVSRLWGEGAASPDVQKEGHILKSMFRGNLVVRRGRKSLGLQSIIKQCFAQQADLEFHSGYTELLGAGFGEGYRVELRKKSLNYWLPGVIATVQMPIHGMKLERARRRLENLRTSDSTEFAELRSLPLPRRLPPAELSFQGKPPKGLFGGLSLITNTRRSESDAVRLLSANQDGAYQVIDLKSSGAIDANFLDSLLQELCKSSGNYTMGSVAAPPSRPLLRLFFINVPKQVIVVLKASACSAFLVESGQLCLMLDEHDHPHFLGATRLTQTARDFEELLTVMYSCADQSLATSDLARMGFQDDVIRQAEALFVKVDHADIKTVRNLPIYFRYQIAGNTYFVWRSTYRALRLRYRLAKSSISDYSAPVRDGVLRLRNGRLFDKAFDFARFWSHILEPAGPSVLSSCAKLLLRKSGFPFASHVISFKGNGSILAGTVRELTGAPNLVLLEMPRSGELPVLPTEIGECLPLLVVDAILPGDWEAYLKYLFDQFPKLKVIAFAALGRAELPLVERLRVTFLDNQPELQPRLATAIGTRVYSPSQMDQILSDVAVSHVAARRDNQSSPSGFGPLELSTEFWQNVAELQIISSKPAPNDERRLLYGENNEAVLAHPRLREQLQEFVENFVKNILQLRLEVVIHPNHAVGAYLAQLISKALPSTPLVVPLSQWKYGGPIQVSTSEFRNIQGRIEAFSRARQRNTGDKEPDEASVAGVLRGKRKRTRCLIVDDSIITGRSIFSMLGIASQLDLKQVGVLVLINRLAPEVSEAISQFQPSFGYFLRFHMPKLEDREEPNGQILRLDAFVRERSASLMARQWSLIHFPTEAGRAAVNHLLRDIDKNVSGSPKIGDESELTTSVVDEVALQILQRLVLHSDDVTIDFTTRLAILFNFRDKIFEADPELVFLEALCKQGAIPGEVEYAQTNQLLRKAIFLLAYSRSVLHGGDNESFVIRCKKLIDFYLTGDYWHTHNSVLCELFMALSAVGSSWLVAALFDVVKLGIARRAWHAYEQCEFKELDLSARNVCASLAWSLEHVVSDRRTPSVAIDCQNEFVSLVRLESTTVDDVFYLVEALFPLLKHDDALRSALKINADNGTAVLPQLLDHASKEHEYLTAAPGYTVSLRIALDLFVADGVIMVAWTDDQEPKLFVKGFESTTQNLVLNHDLTKLFPDALKARMKRQMFVESRDVGALAQGFTTASRSSASKNAEPLVCPDSAPATAVAQYVGMALRPIGGLNHYLLFTYSAVRQKSELLSSFYHWLRYQPIFEDVIRGVQHIYVQSSTTWELLRTSSGVVHVRDNDEQTARGRLIRRIFASVPVGSMLNEIATAYSHKPISLEKVLDQIRDNNRILYERGEVECSPPETNPLKPLGEWPIACLDMKPSVRNASDVYVNFSQPLLTFILYECFSNALMFFKTRIRVSVHYDQTDETLTVTVANDVDYDQIALHEKCRRRSAKGSGLEACEKAATVISGGSFSTNGTDVTQSNGMDYVATLRLPVFEVPENLRGYLT